MPFVWKSIWWCILLTIKICLMTFMDEIPFDQIFQKEWNFNKIGIHKYLDIFEMKTKRLVVVFFLWMILHWFFSYLERLIFYNCKLSNLTFFILWWEFSFDRRSHFCQVEGEALVGKTEFFGVYIGMQVFFCKKIHHFWTFPHDQEGHH